MKFIKLMFLLFLVVLFPLVSSQSSLDVEKTEKDIVIFVEKENSATYELEIENNNGYLDRFQIYSLVVPLEPRDFFTLSSGETKKIEITITPHQDTKEKVRGFYSFEYQIKGQKSGFFEDVLKIKIIEVGDALEIYTDNVLPQDTKTYLYIKNKENTEITDLNIKLTSDFFKYEDTINLNPNEEKKIEITLTKEEYKNLEAGTYDLTARLDFGEAKSSKIYELKYLEKEGVSVSEDTSGLITRTNEITKKNEGNTQVEVEFQNSRNLLTRLFTTNSPDPDQVEKRGFVVDYYWTRTLSPGEEMTVRTTTNYAFPFLIILAIIAVGFGVSYYLGTNLIVKKRISYVKTKGGDLALKVRLSVKARKNVTDIEITDSVPSFMKLYDQFSIKPHKMDPQTRKLHWNLHSLNSGEERVFSYIIYSKIKVVGQFTLPPASAMYKHAGKTMFVKSNSTNFVAENSKED